MHKIEVNMDTTAVEDSVNIFAKFIAALELEASLLNPDVENDELIKQQVETANAYLRDLGILFQLSGDHQKEVDEIFAKMAKSTMMAVNKSDKHRDANEVTQLLDIIKAARKYVKQANLAAEAKHDTLGIFYMDGSTYATMEETKELLTRIDIAIQ